MRVRGFNITTSQGVTAGMVEPPYLTLQVWPKGNGLVVIIFVTHTSKYESPMASWLHVLFCRKEKFKEKRKWKEGNYKGIKAAYITEAPHCLQCYRSSRHNQGSFCSGVPFWLLWWMIIPQVLLWRWRGFKNKKGEFGITVKNSPRAGVFCPGNPGERSYIKLFTYAFT